MLCAASVPAGHGWTVSGICSPPCFAGPVRRDDAVRQPDAAEAPWPACGYPYGVSAGRSYHWYRTASSLLGGGETTAGRRGVPARRDGDGFRPSAGSLPQPAVSLAAVDAVRPDHAAGVRRGTGVRAGRPVVGAAGARRHAHGGGRAAIGDDRDRPGPRALRPG